MASAHLLNEDDLKEIQKQKDDFDSRQLSLDDRHVYILKSLETLFKLKYEVLEDFWCEVEQLVAVDSFLNANGEEKLFLFKIPSPMFKKVNKKIESNSWSEAAPPYQPVQGHVASVRVQARSQGSVLSLKIITIIVIKYMIKR